MTPYRYKKPTTLAEACAALQEEGAFGLAGGTDLIPQLREGRRKPTVLVDLKHLPDCSDIGLDPDGSLIIGAAASATRIAHHPDVATRAPVLAGVARLIGSLQVQNRATFGGNICNAAPSADAVPALIVLGAIARIVGPDGKREAAVESLFAGPGQNTLRRGEVLVSIIVPPPLGGHAAHYLRFTPRREMDIAIAGVAASVSRAPDGTPERVRIALASVAPTPIRAHKAEAELEGQPFSDVAIDTATQRAANDDARPISDTRGSADYRRRLVATLTSRVLVACRNQIRLKEQA